jgi:hypothetical protein
MGVKRAVIMFRAAACCLAFSGMLIAPVAAQTAPASETTATDYCPLHVRVYALPGMADELAFTVWSDDVAGAATGSITAYVNGGRYTIPFKDLIAIDERDAKALPKPIVVKFDAPMQFDSAYVGSLEGGDCAVHAPFVRKPLTTAGLMEDTKVAVFPDRSKDWPGFLAQAAAMTPLPAPAAALAEKPACAKPNVEASTTSYEPPVYPSKSKLDFNGDIVVKIALGADGKVSALRMDHASSDSAFNLAAGVAAGKSKYAPQIYRCKPVTTDYYLDVKFSPYDDERRNQDFRPATGGQMGPGGHI